MSVSGAGQGGSFFSGDVGQDIFKVIEMVLNPMKLVGEILGAITGGDQVTQSNQQPQTGTSTTTELGGAGQMPGYAQGRTKEEDEEMARTLDVLDQNFDLFDTANGKLGKDGKVTMHELLLVANDARLPDEVRDAARKLMNDPVLLARLDKERDGAINGGFGRGDVRRLKARVEAELQETWAAGPAQKPQAQATQQKPVQGPEQTEGKNDLAVQEGGAPPHDPSDFGSAIEGPKLSPNVEQAQSPMTSVLDDPSLNFETKTKLVLESAMNVAEDELTSAYVQLDTLQAAGKEVPASLNFKVQRLMQRRQEMFQLLSNMTTMSHDMAMAAIRNIKG